MTITVKLFATFRQGSMPVQACQLPPGSSVDSVIEAVGVRKTEIGVVMVNGRHAEFDQPLADGDVVAIFPVVGGG